MECNWMLICHYSWKLCNSLQLENIVSKRNCLGGPQSHTLLGTLAYKFDAQEGVFEAVYQLLAENSFDTRSLVVISCSWRRPSLFMA